MRIPYGTTGLELDRDLTGADWVLAADGVPLDTAALEPTDAPCPAGYTLWHNPCRERVLFADPAQAG